MPLRYPECVANRPPLKLKCPKGLKIQIDTNPSAKGQPCSAIARRFCMPVYP